MNNALTHGVEFEDSDIRECSSNTIAENMACRADANGHVSMVLQAIINHRKDDTAYD